jgi:hypothetical protein
MIPPMNGVAHPPPPFAAAGAEPAIITIATPAMSQAAEAFNLDIVDMLTSLVHRGVSL